jgi:hypothetical protein
VVPEWVPHFARVVPEWSRCRCPSASRRFSRSSTSNEASRRLSVVGSGGRRSRTSSARATSRSPRSSARPSLHLSRRTTPVRVLAFGQQPACKPYHFECNVCGTLHLYNELRYVAFVVAVRLRDVHDVHSLALEGLLKLKLDNLGVTHEPQPARALVPQAGPKPAAASELAPQACTERSIAPLASRRRRQSLLAFDSTRQAVSGAGIEPCARAV